MWHDGLAVFDVRIMKAKKAAATKKPNLVVVPPPPDKTGVVTRTKPALVVKKRPSDPREKPAARDSQGKASRAEIRREEPRRVAPRATGRDTERGNQQRSRKAVKK